MHNDNKVLEFEVFSAPMREDNTSSSHRVFLCHQELPRLQNPTLCHCPLPTIQQRKRPKGGGGGQSEDEVSPLCVNMVKDDSIGLRMMEIFLPLVRHIPLFPLKIVYSCPSCLLKHPSPVLKSPLPLFLSSISHFIALYKYRFLTRENRPLHNQINTEHVSSSSFQQTYRRSMHRRS